jgi:DNA repair photolyase
MQTSLFDQETNDFPRPGKLGHTEITYDDVSSILTPGSGFMDAYDFTLNPYSGCSFGCNYCYAAFFSRDREQRDNWGNWVKVKDNALTLLRKKRPQCLTGKTIYMSSVTDPYQPIEKKLKLVRGLLEELVRHHQPRLVIQTRSPVVTRDIDVLGQFDHVQVNMTVTTDSEDVRRAFEPTCPNNKVRLHAIREIKNAGINACITLTPLLPVENPDLFADMLLETGVETFIVQPFHSAGGKFIAGTREAANEVIARYNWSDARYREVLSVLRARLPNLGLGKQGFAPPI